VRVAHGVDELAGREPVCVVFPPTCPPSREQRVGAMLKCTPRNMSRFAVELAESLPSAT